MAIVWAIIIYFTKIANGSGQLIPSSTANSTIGFASNRETIQR
jgi:hypothetical protein